MSKGNEVVVFFREADGELSAHLVSRSMLAAKLRMASDVANSLGFRVGEMRPHGLSYDGIAVEQTIYDATKARALRP